jgi:hypothetical protein
VPAIPSCRRCPTARTTAPWAIPISTPAADRTLRTGNAVDKRFGSERPFSVGIEEELFLVDPDTLPGLAERGGGAGNQRRTHRSAGMTRCCAISPA